MGNKAGLSARGEDYLKAVLFLSEKTGEATSKAISAELAISPGSATIMFKKLAALGLLSYAPYGMVRLTAPGEKKAWEIVRHHRLLETFLRQTLHYPLERVHAEADELEHAISEEFEERLAALLGHPLTDPHGSPIPGRQGPLPAESETGSLPLTQLESGRRATITGLRHREPDLLAYLEELGILPGAKLTLLERKPFSGPLIVQVEGRAPEAIGHEMAAKIRVALPGIEETS